MFVVHHTVTDADQVELGPKVLEGVFRTTDEAEAAIEQLTANFKWRGREDDNRRRWWAKNEPGRIHYYWYQPANPLP